MTDSAGIGHRARLRPVHLKRLLLGVLFLAVVWGTVAPAHVAEASDLFDSAAQSDRPENGALAAPSDSDDEIRLVMALLIAVAVIALLGTFVYWVRTGDTAHPDREDSPNSAGSEDTLG